jgi:site-specific DNA recombinase
MEDKMRLAALYTRVSTEMQEREQTIQSQLAAVRGYADQHQFRYTTATTYTDEGYSGARLDRPGLDELRDHAREGRFDVIVVLCPDRLARRYAYQVLLLEEFKRASVEVHFCEHPIGGSPDDELLLQIQGAIAEYERAKIIERMRRGRLHRARMGELGPPRPPYGYRYAARKHGGDGELRIHEDEAAMVRQVFTWYTEEGATVYKILGRLNASQWKPRSGSERWAYATVLRMLRCEWYVGRAYYNRNACSVNERTDTAYPSRKRPRLVLTERPRSEWITVPVPRIVDDDLFACVRQRMQNNRRFARRRLRQEGVFLLSGLLKCGLCGHAFVGKTRREKCRRGGMICYYTYHCCSQTVPECPKHCRCSSKALHVAGVNEAVWSVIRDLLLDSKAFSRQLADWLTRSNAQPTGADSDLAKFDARLKEFHRQRERLTDAYQGGVLHLEAFRTRLKTLDDRIFATEQARTAEQTHISDHEVAKAHVLGAEAFIERLRPRLAGADFETRQRILRLVVDKIIVTGQQLEIHLAVPVSGNCPLTSKETLFRNESDSGSALDAGPEKEGQANPAQLSLGALRQLDSS